MLHQINIRSEWRHITYIGDIQNKPLNRHNCSAFGDYISVLAAHTGRCIITIMLNGGELTSRPCHRITAQLTQCNHLRWYIEAEPSRTPHYSKTIAHTSIIIIFIIDVTFEFLIVQPPLIIGSGMYTSDNLNSWSRHFPVPPQNSEIRFRCSEPLHNNNYVSWQPRYRSVLREMSQRSNLGAITKMCENKPSY